MTGLSEDLGPTRLGNHMAGLPGRFSQLRWLQNVACVAAMIGDALALVAFTGELTASLVAVLPRPHKLRWKDTFLVMERVGCDAFVIVAVVSALFGLILAFQAAIPLERFGAAIFVVDLVGIAVTRELGPLITAIILAGRTGSAFAAELGTMKVNEELNALDTMGLEPVHPMHLIICPATEQARRSEMKPLIHIPNRLSSTAATSPCRLNSTMASRATPIIRKWSTH